MSLNFYRLIKEEKRSKASTAVAESPSENAISGAIGRTSSDSAFSRYLTVHINNHLQAGLILLFDLVADPYTATFCITIK